MIKKEAPRDPQIRSKSTRIFPTDALMPSCSHTLILSHSSTLILSYSYPLILSYPHIFPKRLSTSISPQNNVQLTTSQLNENAITTPETTKKQTANTLVSRKEKKKKEKKKKKKTLKKKKKKKKRPSKATRH